MREKKRKTYQIRVAEDELQTWKDAALDQRYRNLSDFIRDAITDKIEFGQEAQDGFYTE